MSGTRAHSCRRLEPFPTPAFLSDVFLSLHADWSANVAGIFMDQWFLVVVEQMLPSGDERRIAVQADAAEDGLAAVWAFLASPTAAAGG